MKLLRVTDVVSLRRALVQDAVSIENDGWSPSEEALRAWESLDGSDAVIAMIGDVGEQFSSCDQRRVYSLLEESVFGQQQLQNRARQERVADLDATQSRGRAAPVEHLDEAALVHANAVPRVAVPVAVD